MDEEVQRALYGVKQMKEVLWRNEQKHEHLMISLKHSDEKKQVRREQAQREESESLSRRRKNNVFLSVARRQHNWLRR